MTITTGNDQDAAKRIISMKIAASSLGGVFSDGWNVGGALTVGFGFNSAIKSLTAGGDYMHSRSESEGILALIDIDGDGLPDKVFRSKDNDCLYYRSQYIGQDGYPNFSGERTPIAGIDGFMNERSRTNDWGLRLISVFTKRDCQLLTTTARQELQGQPIFPMLTGMAFLT